MNEPTMDDWQELKVMVRQCLRDHIATLSDVDTVANSLRFTVERWALDRDLWTPNRYNPEEDHR
jgi:hypothetical protein